MREEIVSAFGLITAEAELVTDTTQYVTEKTKQPAGQPLFRKLAAVACALALVLVIGFGAAARFTSTAYISIDINPSIELELNRFDRVTKAVSINAEAAQLLDGLSLKGKPYDVAIQQILAAEQEQGYINKQSMLLVAVQSSNAKQQEQLMAGVQQSTKKYATGGQSRLIAIDEGTKQQAQKYGLTAGKYSAIQELQKVDATATIEKYKNSSVRTILEQTESKQAAVEKKAVRQAKPAASAGNRAQAAPAHSKRPQVEPRVQQTESRAAAAARESVERIEGKAPNKARPAGAAQEEPSGGKASSGTPHTPGSGGAAPNQGAGGENKATGEWPSSGGGENKATQENPANPSDGGMAAEQQGGDSDQE